MADIGLTESSEVTVASSDGVNKLLINADGSLNVVGPTAPTSPPITVVLADTNAARQGKLYLSNSTFLNITTPTERDFLLLRNPAASGKVFTIEELLMTSDENIGATYRVRIYLNPTITANGTSITPINARQVGTTAVSALVSSLPTISARGALAYVKNFTIGSPVVESGVLLLDPGNNYLVTMQTDNTANFNITLIHSELVGI
jgi:hypothetical protein